MHEECQHAHAQCGCQRVGWACVYSSAGCCWLLMFLGKCNVVPNASGIKIPVGVGESLFYICTCACFKSQNRVPRKLRGTNSVCWLDLAGLALLAGVS